MSDETPITDRQAAYVADELHNLFDLIPVEDWAIKMSIARDIIDTVRQSEEL